MKKNYWIYILLLMVTAVVPSCKKVENEPRDLYTYDLTYDPQDQNAVLAQRALAGLYNFLPAGFNRVNGDFLDAATDDAVSSISNSPVSYYTNGIVSVGNNPDSYFSNSYNGIRQANIFLANIDKVPVPAANPNRTLGFKAEARFIRAFLYFELLKRYGGIPLVGDKVFGLDDNLQLPRNTYAQCVDYIAAECTAIKDLLYADAIADVNLGRVVKGAAVALKCRLYLYAASPLFNGGGIEADASLKALTGYPNADPSRWQKVVDAVAEFNSLGYYSLLQSGTAGYRSIFINKKNTEVIFAKQSVNNTDLENLNSPVGYNGGSAASAGRTNPTQDFVDAFTTVNGKSITTDLKSATNPTGYDPANPYLNRDPRFDATVFYNGQRWLSRPVETFEGGRDKPNSNVNTQTRTGYYLRKFLGDLTNSTNYPTQSHNFVYFRLAEIILNNAEALNELGNTETSVQQIILIRKRAGIVAGSDGRYGIKAGISQAEMRVLIQNERRIELSFEEHRFFDLRRWKIAGTALNKTLTGVTIVKNPDGVTFKYQVVPVVNITFQDKLYHLPLPYDETVKNTGLVQNFGW
ncbi:RagB/SusD family nutrient uptake outer membrane protein [Mucilaginibacter glaciei]|uniref:RagB/SusD family nutrient uptake outer membrane protein n=1 Tax=Mucilaginibacter glaciei TaxID=2772109 RepID=A0A926NSP3_9SPHI|nr:RagB/SusD family nutrient uptake outer membrane protein [Mucilaginibacter glaciei]MBD1395356.1 RagB/SusD family nutrient uptake outer membrane protein [Mucilaginibacter glaciei]